MTAGRLGGRSEDRFRQLSDSCNPLGNSIPQTLPEALYSFHADPEIYPRTTHSTGNISAFITTMDRPRSWSAYFVDLRGIMFHVRRDQMVRHDVLQKVEPEQRNLGQHSALVRNAGREDVVERRNAVGGHEEQAVVIQPVNIPNLPAGVKLKFRDSQFAERTESRTCGLMREILQAKIVAYSSSQNFLSTIST